MTADTTEPVVYLLCLSKPFRHARHYLGSTTNLEKRLATHGTKHGAKMLLAARQAGITWTLVRTWQGGRSREKQLKSHSVRNCPVCTPKRRRTSDVPAHPDSV